MIRKTRPVTTGLKPGRYELEVAVTDRATGRKGASSVPFAVVSSDGGPEAPEPAPGGGIA